MNGKDGVPVGFEASVERDNLFSLLSLNTTAPSPSWLGGAVAKLATLRLLRELPDWPAPKIKCLCFATPAVGNGALADLVETAGWGGYFKTYFTPGE